ncbi:hypothetical protein GCM10022243_19760 [Saccharothrix violaceirubra]|uniref:Subtilisin inhibitor domain-containing protein n=1 Tax=Saccharothrix violaceirubra TaxID=413306 RepID=A0A7W7WW26_9PSEU|nr:SSI family serine proteinase inhibitor [Saccharothrix violaceirubra]MBB4965118.1 hypothetical protein [Saccharothrix violaceirubra]
MRIIGTALSAAALVVATAAPAGATEQTGLYLVISDPDGTWGRGVSLDCPPNRALHPHAESACADLDMAGGDFDNLPGDQHPCTLEYDPVEATAEGTYQGNSVRWTAEFSNACTLDADTGWVFRF